MATIVKTRTLRPSTHKASSPYRIHTDNIRPSDLLRIKIFEEKQPSVILFLYEIGGNELRDRSSIHFKASKVNSRWAIRWVDAQPRRVG